jgi:hypothetical protein
MCDVVFITKAEKCSGGADMAPSVAALTARRNVLNHVASERLLRTVIDSP